MMCEELFLKHIKEKCYEVRNLRDSYFKYRELVRRMAEQLQITRDRFNSKVDRMNEFYYSYTQAYRDLSQLCYLAGGKALKMFNEIVEESEE
jgi:hypothetical protein